MKIRFHALTGMENPGLHVWHKNLVLAHHPATKQGPCGWHRFDIRLTRHKTIGFKLFGGQASGEHWEEFDRILAASHGEYLPRRIWFAEGSDRILRTDPLAMRRERVRIHLLTRNKFQDSSLFLWTPGTEPRHIPSEGRDKQGPYFDIRLDENTCHLFHFKFIRPDGSFEENFANRTWCASDGDEIWTPSGSSLLCTSEPTRKSLTIYLGHHWPREQVGLHLWQGGREWGKSSDFTRDWMGERTETPFWTRFHIPDLYTNLPYGLLFFRRSGSNQDPLLWEHEDARRFITLEGDETFYTLEGDSTLFPSRPAEEVEISLHVAAREPGCGIRNPDRLEIRINNSMSVRREKARRTRDGSFVLRTYPGVVTAFRFGEGGQWENTLHRIHSQPANNPVSLSRYVVLGRSPVLNSPPPSDLFTDPPFPLPGQGVFRTEDSLLFVLHAPSCSRIRLQGEWMHHQETFDLRSTRDSMFWWGKVPLDGIQPGMSPRGNGYHGARYRYICNAPCSDRKETWLNQGSYVQDPAAQWVASTHPNGFSKLVDHSIHQWRTPHWDRPGWDTLTVLQLHPDRFTRRNTKHGNQLPPFLQVAEEIRRKDGYIRNLGVSAILLMPVSQTGSPNNWGYDPSYFFAVQNSYGGPEGLKELVDVCHFHGIAVLLDLVFNHVGTDHSILHEVAPEQFLDGETIWGSLIDFDSAACMEFFAQNCLYWMDEFRIDGFRFDHTRTMLQSHEPGYFSIRRPGSGGGLEFLRHLHRLVKQEDGKCLLMAEHLPNDWALTNAGGPMDTQWADDFHDRLVEVCRGEEGSLSGFAASLQFSQWYCDSWFNLTQYAESHDEVGNVNSRIVHVAGPECGFRMAKVACAATLLSRSIPLFFMGEESGESDQFLFGADDALDLARYEQDPDHKAVRRWWMGLLKLRRERPGLFGPAPLRVHFAADMLLAFSRGEPSSLFVVLNFSPVAYSRTFSDLHPDEGTYVERINSTWPEFQVQREQEQHNGGPEVRLTTGDRLQIPDFGVVLLERIKN